MNEGAVEEPQRQIATVRDYDQLVSALRKRADQLDVSREEIDATSGLQPGYSATLLSPVPRKRLGLISLGPMLQALGLKLLVVEDEAATHRFADGMAKRKRKVRRTATDRIVITKRSLRTLRRMGRLGRERRWGKMSEAQRAEWARGMNATRWARVREAERRAQEREQARLAALSATAIQDSISPQMEQISAS